MGSPRVLSVGQCSMDHGTISRHLKRAFDADVARADTFHDALGALRAGGYDLVLINRVTDADGTHGLDLIRTLKADAGLVDTPVLLVSNYADAQADAQALGARPGFGKAAIGSADADAKLRDALKPISPAEA